MPRCPFNHCATKEVRCCKVFARISPDNQIGSTLHAAFGHGHSKREPHRHSSTFTHQFMSLISLTWQFARLVWIFWIFGRGYWHCNRWALQGFYDRPKNNKKPRGSCRRIGCRLADILRCPPHQGVLLFLLVFSAELIYGVRNTSKSFVIMPTSKGPKDPGIESC